MALQKTSDYGPGDNNFTAFQNSLDSQRRGDSSITITEADSSSAPSVIVGSWFECDGALYEIVTGNETPTGYSGISNSTVFYMYFDVSATAFIYDSTAPSWSDAKQGYYHPTNTTDRAFYSIYKDSGGTLYNEKIKLLNKNEIRSGYLFGQYQFDYIFSRLSSIIPDTGDVMVLNGGYSNDGATDTYLFSHVERFTSTQMRFYGIRTVTNTRSILTVDSTNTATAQWTIAW